MTYGVIDDSARVRGFYCAAVFCAEFHPYAPTLRREPRATRWVAVPLPTPVQAKLGLLRAIHRRLTHPDAS